MLENCGLSKCLPQLVKGYLGSEFRKLGFHTSSTGFVQLNLAQNLFFLLL